LTDTTIFGDDQSPVAPVINVETPVVTKQLPPGVDQLVGDGKKYASVDVALAAIPHAQSHISNLESELAVVREELSKRKTTQELLDEIKSGIPQGTTIPKVETNQDEIINIVNHTIAQKEVQRVAQDNTEQVRQVFTKQFGDNAEKIYIALAAEAGLTVEALNKLTALSPKAVLKMAGIKESNTGNTGRIHSDVNTQALQAAKQPDIHSAKAVSFNTKDVMEAMARARESIKQQTG
jgi:hypothetical protein